MSPGTRIAAVGEAARITTEPNRGSSEDLPGEPGRFDEASGALRRMFDGARIDDPLDVPGSGPIALGSFTFDPRDPGSALVVPKEIYGLCDGVAWKTEIRLEPDSFTKEAPASRPGTGEGRAAPAGGSAPASPDPDEERWAKNFARVHMRLAAQGLQKVVLARRVVVDSPEPFQAARILESLALNYPECFLFLFDGLVGASPELLVRKLGNVVDSLPIAGSAPRGRNPEDDERLGIELQASLKNRAEHELTKQAVIEGLRPFCSAIEAEPQPSLLLLANVQHLSTKVQGRLNAPLDCLRLAGALHPTPAVCGVPSREALEAIRSIEGFSRQRYAGPVGWIDHRGDGEWAIALRCAQLQGRRATLWAGAGILPGSEARSEFEETSMKFEAILSALASPPQTPGRPVN